MSSLLIKVTNNGLSKEYLHNTAGPITIGSDKFCDVIIDDPQVGAKLLEVKLSAGEIYVQEVSSSGVVFINSITPASQQETHYHEGDCISVKNSYYQIYIYKAPADVVEPPPFFEDEFQERLKRMDAKIREKESHLKTLDAERRRKGDLLVELENTLHVNTSEKNRLEIELNSLKAHKEAIGNEIQSFTEQNRAEYEKSGQLSEFVSRLQDEERLIKNKIDAHNLMLGNLKGESENKSKELNQQRVHFEELQLDIKRSKDKLMELVFLHETQEQKNIIESAKTQNLLASSDKAFIESVRIQELITKGQKEKLLQDMECHALKEDVEALEHQKREAQNKLNELAVAMGVEEIKSQNIRAEIEKQSEEKRSLASLNIELQSELVKLEEKLSLKKNQLNQTDFQNQELLRKLTTVNFELEQANLRLKEISTEERTQELKMMAIREDLQNFSRKASTDKLQITKSIEDEKVLLNLEKKTLLTEIGENEKQKQMILSEQVALKTKIENLDASCKVLSAEKVSLVNAVDELKTSKSKLESQIGNLKKSVENLEHETIRAQRELTLLQHKIVECVTQIKEKQGEAQLELENLKRTERAKLSAEKEIQLAEVENFKQKSLIEIESSYRQKLDDVHNMKLQAQLEADEVLQTARTIEAQMTEEATRRLKDATHDAQERETLSHQRILDAQEYFKQKELESDSIINKARLESRDLMKKAEIQLLDDLAKRKQKIKKFLNMKQENGTAHLKALSEQAVIRLKKGEEKAHQKLEDLKRRELKKVAKIREEEFSRISELKTTALKEYKNERENVLKKIAVLKQEQEAQLAEKKKSVVDHINSIKIESQQSWDKEIKRERELFQKTKRDRIQNATQAVLNVLIAESGTNIDNDLQLREKIKTTLEMAIDGQNAEAIDKVGQILDFNPINRKKIIPVLQKYSVNFGIPAAITIVLLADIGSVRTSLIGQAKQLMKQQNTASQMYVNKQQTEWKEKHTFNPVMTPGYKATFTDNVIYTTDFEKIMENDEFQNDWILKVHNFLVKDLELSEDIAINYISAEGALIKELSIVKKELHPQFLDQGLKKMGNLEEAHLGWLKQKIVKPENMEKFAAFRKNNFDNFYNSNLNTKLNPNREIATEKKN